MLEKLEALKATTGRDTASKRYLECHPRTVVFDDLQTAWNAFADLDRCGRPWPGARISPSEIEAWGRLHGMRDPEVTDLFYFAVRTLDEASFEMRSRKRAGPDD